MRIIAVCVAGLLAGVGGPQTGPPYVRTGGPQTGPPYVQGGTAVLSGTVTTDDAARKPVPNALVTLNHVDQTYGDTAVSDEQGHYELRNVPAGRYLLSALKAGFIRTRYGAARPGRAGTPIAIANGQRVANIVLRLAPGAAITGRVTGPDGEPAEGVEVELKQYITIGGERRVEDVDAAGTSRTDDRGIYRLYGLPAAEYIVIATPGGGRHDHESSPGLLPTTAADVRWARAQLQAAPGGGRPMPVGPPPRTMSSYAQVYYPNALQRSGATPITLAPGEERAGIDFTIQLRPAHRVEGRVLGIGGNPPASTPSIMLVDVSGEASGFSGVKETSGTSFVFEGVAPGQYSIVAMVESTKEWAISDVSVGAQNVSVSLTLQPGLTLSGRVSFQGTAPPPTDLTRVRVSAIAAGSPGGLSVQPLFTPAKADGSFALQGMMPGRYRLSATMPGPAAGAGGWAMRSAIAGTQDIADVPVELRPGSSLANVAVTFTDRATELTGRLQDASGRAAADYFIIVFGADERAWFTRSRRIAQTRPSNDGQFVVRGLPPGDYLLAALTDVESGEWFDAAFLRQLVPNAMKISLTEGEKKVQDVAIRR